MILKAYMRFYNLLKKTRPKSSYRFYDIGFHGDMFLIALIETIANNGIEYFVETGTNVGSSIAYFAKKYPSIECMSCEFDQEAFKDAYKNCSSYKNVSLYNALSQKFLAIIEKNKPDIFNKECLFWLDAHGYGLEWPLKYELDFITNNFSSAHILIDDFMVPGRSYFKYCKEGGQFCSFENIKSFLNQRHRYRVYYPNYTEKTSQHHPLVGWSLIEFGHEKELILTEKLGDRISKPISVFW